MQKFRLAPWNRTVWILTITTFITIGLTFLLLLQRNMSLSLYFLYLILSLGPIIPIYLFAPQSYSISEDQIIIHRMIGNIVINQSEILSTELIENYDHIAYRAFAVGGLFGFFGAFVLKNGERATLYCSRLDHVVAIKTEHKSYVISPENPEKFCGIVRMK